MLGRASIDLRRQSGESLAGRVSYLELTPFPALEAGAERALREQLWLRGACRRDPCPAFGRSPGHRRQETRQPTGGNVLGQYLDRMGCRRHGWLKRAHPRTQGS